MVVGTCVLVSSASIIQHSTVLQFFLKLHETCQQSAQPSPKRGNLCPFPGLHL
jgi:hypothetical protein